MLTEQERRFAIEASIQMEQLMGQLLMFVTSENAPSIRARRAAHVLVTAGVIKKFEMCRLLPHNFAKSLDAVLDQLNALGGDDLNDKLDLRDIVIPDGLDDYINLEEFPEQVMQ
jgi:hypothetical protein